ncbi:MAG: hypothetical protein EBU66_17225 [Bacteroidetes bacterium]|nr:hypothetical protein [Bacteroidota bacterium]
MVNIYAAVGQDIIRIRDKFNYRNYGQMVNIYGTLGQRQSRIRDKLDTAVFVASVPLTVYTVGQDQGKIVDKFDVGKMAFSVPFRLYAVGQKEGRIYTKQLTGSDFGYLAFGSTANAAVGNIDYQFWS